MKKVVTLICGLLFTLISFAQDQIINGSLTTVKDLCVGQHIEGKFGFGAKLHFRGNQNNTDHFWIAKNARSNDQSDLCINLADYGNGDRLVITTDYFDYLRELFVVTTQGKGRVGIGVSFPQSELEVNGTIRAKEVKIEATGWADFVFSQDYKLPTLSEVENHIKENKHLPDIPSEKEMIKNGVNVNEMQIKLLQKIEELTLYVIEQNKKIEKLEENNNKQEQLIQELQSKIDE